MAVCILGWNRLWPRPRDRSDGDIGYRIEDYNTFIYSRTSCTALRAAFRALHRPRHSQSPTPHHAPSKNIQKQPRRKWNTGNETKLPRFQTGIMQLSQLLTLHFVIGPAAIWISTSALINLELWEPLSKLQAQSALSAEIVESTPSRSDSLKGLHACHASGHERRALRLLMLRRLSCLRQHLSSPLDSPPLIIARTMATDTQVKRFNCVVVGSGQSGTPLASALAKSGRTTALIERAHIGGTCVNEGNHHPSLAIACLLNPIARMHANEDNDLLRPCRLSRAPRPGLRDLGHTHDEPGEGS